jgi:hypothetical protein
VSAYVFLALGGLVVLYLLYRTMPAVCVIVSAFLLCAVSSIVFTTSAMSGRPTAVSAVVFTSPAICIWKAYCALCL